MRLDQAESLSPQELLRESRTPIMKPPAAPRSCCRCGTPDRLEVIQGEIDGRGESMVEHFVTVELRYVKTEAELTKRLQLQGWRWKQGKLHQGRLAIERLICRPCMNLCGLMEREWRSKRAREQRSTVNHDTYYELVCEETP